MLTQREDTGPVSVPEKSESKRAVTDRIRYWVKVRMQIPHKIDI